MAPNATTPMKPRHQRTPSPEDVDDDPASTPEIVNFTTNDYLMDSIAKNWAGKIMSEGAVEKRLRRRLKAITQKDIRGIKGHGQDMKVLELAGSKIKLLDDIKQWTKNSGVRYDYIQRDESNIRDWRLDPNAAFEKSKELAAESEAKISKLKISIAPNSTKKPRIDPEPLAMTTKTVLKSSIKPTKTTKRQRQKETPKDRFLAIMATWEKEIKEAEDEKLLSEMHDRNLGSQTLITQKRIEMNEVLARARNSIRQPSHGLKGPGQNPTTGNKRPPHTDSQIKNPRKKVRSERSSLSNGRGDEEEAIGYPETSTKTPRSRSGLLEDEAIPFSFCTIRRAEHGTSSVHTGVLCSGIGDVIGELRDGGVRAYPLEEMQRYLTAGIPAAKEGTIRRLHAVCKDFCDRMLTEKGLKAECTRVLRRREPELELKLD